jgi:long-chain acyl-CoA synthetase
MIEMSSKHYFDRPALSMVGDIPISYGQLDGLTRLAASTMKAWGLRQGDRIAIIAESSPSWGIAFLGAARLGSIPVPILTDFTKEQIANIVEHSGSSMILCSDKLFPKLEPIGTSIPILDVVNFGRKNPGNAAASISKGIIEKENKRFKDATPVPDDTAMIIYTSGTTGLSKGVMLSHKNVLSNAIACKSIIALRRTDRLLSILPLAHSYEFTIGFLIPLLMGSHIHYLDRPPSATVLLPALKAVRPTIMLSVPLVIEKIYRSSIKPTLESMKVYKITWLRPLLVKFAGAKLKATFGGKMRFFGVGGAPLSAEVEEFLKKAGFPYAIGYGLTETAPLIAGSGPKHTRLRSTGPALEGVTLKIADPRPDTGEGEIQAKGPNVFKGYYRDPLRTMEAFADGGWFRTGDLGFIDKNGIVYVRGRIKTMILGATGENIYPEEVEAVLNRSPFVAESLVVGDENGLTAFVYLKSEVLENLEARIKDGIENAESFAAHLGSAVSHAGKSGVESLGHTIVDAEKAVSSILDRIKKEANEKLASFSKIRTIKIHNEPFEKTPTQKIKRFLYTKDTAGNSGKNP